MKKIKCKICGTEFVRTTSQVCCSLECRKENIRRRNRQWKLDNPEKVKKQRDHYNNTPERKEYMKEYGKLEKTKSGNKRASKKWRERNLETRKNSFLKKRYGITFVDYQFMVKAQDNKCAICNKPETRITTKGGSPQLCDLAVDHCHTTGKVRGLLCFDCNTSLGKFNDSIEIVERALDYLKSNEDGEF